MISKKRWPFGEKLCWWGLIRHLPLYLAGSTSGCEGWRLDPSQWNRPYWQTCFVCRGLHPCRIFCYLISAETSNKSPDVAATEKECSLSRSETKIEKAAWRECLGVSATGIGTLCSSPHLFLVFDFEHIWKFLLLSLGPGQVFSPLLQNFGFWPSIDSSCSKYRQIMRPDHSKTRKRHPHRTPLWPLPTISRTY